MCVWHRKCGHFCEGTIRWTYECKHQKSIPAPLGGKSDATGVRPLRLKGGNRNYKKLFRAGQSYSRFIVFPTRGDRKFKKKTYFKMLTRPI